MYVASSDIHTLSYINVCFSRGEERVDGNASIHLGLRVLKQYKYYYLRRRFLAAAFR
jgi:hypothetical protein